MPTCKHCGRSGFFLSLTHVGICKECKTAIGMEVVQAARIVNESMKLVENSKKIDTQLSRCDVILQYAERLLKYESQGIPTIHPLPSELITEYQRKKEELIAAGLRPEAERARGKAGKALRTYTESARVDQAYTPREIDLDRVPYIPLPPSPVAWEEWRYGTCESGSAKDLFQLIDSSGWNLTETKELAKEDRPETFFREIRATSEGTLFIDTKGKNEKYPGCKSSLLKRNREGRVVGERGLDHDIYRIATSPLNDYYAFMSSEGGLYAYNGALERIFEHQLSQDPRIIAHYETTLPTWGTIKSHIRNIDIATHGKDYLFTIADTAWCINGRLESNWGISMPLNEGWERVVRKTTTAGPREEVVGALNELGLRMPVTQEAIKHKYRELALKWHPDINKEANAKERMQSINNAFSTLTGVNPDSLEIKERTVFDYWKRPDYCVDMDGIALSFGVMTGNPNDWIYASDFAADQMHVYLGSYAGKIVKVDSRGTPLLVYDVSSIPRRITDTGDYLYIQTDTRVYVIRENEELVDIKDIRKGEKLIIGDEGFGVVGSDSLKWFNEDGQTIGAVVTKHPIRAVCPSRKNITVETRQHRAVLTITAPDNQ